MLKYGSVGDNLALASEFLYRGYVPDSDNSGHLMLAGDCTNPVRRTLSARAYTDHTPTRASPVPYLREVRDITNDQAHFIDLTVRCRKCENCAQARRIEWLARSHQEFRFNQTMNWKTYMATLTFKPRHFRRHISRNPKKYLQAKKDNNTWTFFSSYAAAETQKYFKRLRKAGIACRYIAVTEAHKSGLPHVHALIFARTDEISTGALKKGWRGNYGDDDRGFGEWHRVYDTPALYYVTKYLTKDCAARIRASQYYGEGGDPRTICQLIDNRIRELNSLGIYLLHPPSGGYVGGAVSTHRSKKTVTTNATPPLPAAAGEETQQGVKEGGH